MHRICRVYQVLTLMRLDSNQCFLTFNQLTSSCTCDTTDSPWLCFRGNKAVLVRLQSWWCRWDHCISSPWGVRAAELSYNQLLRINNVGKHVGHLAANKVKMSGLAWHGPHIPHYKNSEKTKNEFQLAVYLVSCYEF